VKLRLEVIEAKPHAVLKLYVNGERVHDVTFKVNNMVDGEVTITADVPDDYIEDALFYGEKPEGGVSFKDALEALTKGIA
jgi:hypothetical protein